MSQLTFGPTLVGSIEDHPSLNESLRSNLVGISKVGLRSGVIVVITKSPVSEWILVPREGGGYLFCRPDRLPQGATLEAELAMRQRMIDGHRREELRRNWSADLASPLERLDDVLVLAVARRGDAGREPRSSRRVVRAGPSSRDGSSSDDEPHPLRRQLRATARCWLDATGVWPWSGWTRLAAEAQTAREARR